MTTTSTGPVFSAGGLASGLDTNSIIESLVKIESNSVTIATTQQSAYKTQISEIGELTTRIQALATAAAALKTNGVLGVAQVGTTLGFSATPSSSASAGSYAIQVDTLATAAKARSTSFTAGTTVTGSTLTLGFNGTTYNLDVADGSSLDTVAGQINQLGAPVSAVVLTTTGGTQYLSLTNKDTGFTVGQNPSDALTFSETITGSTGQALNFAITQPATNSTFSVDGLPFERTTNTVADALPGTTLNLTKKTTAPETLVLANDATATQSNLQKFVDSYNSLMNLVRAHLNVKTTQDRSLTLAGDSSLRALQTKMENMVSGVLGTGSATVRTLADVGIKTGTDGTLSIDSARLSSAIGTDARAVNALFQTATTGLGDIAKSLSKTYTDGVDGIFTSRTSGLNNSVKRLDTTISNLQLRVDGYRKTLVAQFAAMEKIVGSFKSVATFLTQQDASRTASNK